MGLLFMLRVFSSSRRPSTLGLLFKSLVILRNSPPPKIIRLVLLLAINNKSMKSSQQCCKAAWFCCGRQGADKSGRSATTKERSQPSCFGDRRVRQDWRDLMFIFMTSLRTFSWETQPITMPIARNLICIYWWKKAGEAVAGKPGSSSLFTTFLYTFWLDPTWWHGFRKPCNHIRSSQKV